MNMKYFFYLALVLGLISCEPEITDFTPDKGEADFTRYVAIGNSLTAGFADGALYQSAQPYSWANILGKQMESVGGQEFVYPEVESEFGVLTGKRKLGYSTSCVGSTSLAPVPDEGVLDPFSRHVGYPVHNLGVPGAKLVHLLANGYGNPALVPQGLASPYFARFAATPEISVLEQAISMTPTFFSVWIGSNDVLGYAVAGGDGDAITPSADFETYYQVLLQSLVATGAKGVVANIPDIETAAFFNTIPYNPIVLGEEQAVIVDQLNSGYAAYNAAMEQFGLPYRIEFSLGANAMVIADPAMGALGLPAELQIRQVAENERVLLTLPQDSLQCANWGTMKPIPPQFILTESELNSIAVATANYNATIQQAAEVFGLAFVDVNKLMNEVAESGLRVDGIQFTQSFVTGNTFSLDGIHLTAQANAVLANYFIDAINQTYGANIPQVAVSSYPGIAFH